MPIRLALLSCFETQRKSHQKPKIGLSTNNFKKKLCVMSSSIGGSGWGGRCDGPVVETVFLMMHTGFMRGDLALLVMGVCSFS